MLRLATLIAALALAGSYGGALHPMADSLAVFRPGLALAVMLGALAWRGRARQILLAGAMIALAPILWQMRPPPPVPEAALTLYQKNLLFTLADPAPVVADIRESGADLVFLQEVSTRNRAVPEALEDAYPHQLICDAHSVGGVAILSRHAFAAPGQCLDARGAAAAQIDSPLGRVTAVVLHLHWPWPFGQAAHVERILPQLAPLPGPVLVAGDFNMVPWATSTRRIARVTDSHRVGPVAPSLMLKRLYPLMIDHILIPQDWRGAAEMRPRLGSDHRGMVARVGPVAR